MSNPETTAKTGAVAEISRWVDSLELQESDVEYVRSMLTQLKKALQENETALSNTNKTLENFIKNDQQVFALRLSCLAHALDTRITACTSDQLLANHPCVRILTSIKQEINLAIAETGIANPSELPIIMAKKITMFALSPLAADVMERHEALEIIEKLNTPNQLSSKAWQKAYNDFRWGMMDRANYQKEINFEPFWAAESALESLEEKLQLR